ncbi:MAG: sulfatase [Bacteroidales bacterium]|nr:sulfatase [Bacteroidales bacterium]
MKSRFNLVGILLFVLGILSCHSQKRTKAKPNVLFIIVDDLRPELHCYGDSLIQSPNMDRLARKGILFTHEFVTVPTCGASRYSLLTGFLPRNRGALSNDACRHYIGEAKTHDVPETFIERLRNHGYYTVGIGKISHYADGKLYPYSGNPERASLELPHSWDEMLFDAGKWGTGWNAFFGYADGSNRNTKKYEVKPYECAEVPDSGYPDGLTAQLAVKKLRELAGKKQPFFLGVGFFKPHLPFNAPEKYWNLYNENKLSLTPSPDIPRNVNAASLHNSGEFNSYKLGEEHPTLKNPVSEAYARKLRHAYFAAISYVDAQVGKVLDELDRQGLIDNTIVILWGDHGWHLGDDRVWGKHTVFEWALRSAFMMRVPGMKQNTVCEKIVSSVDIYPTLMELCGIRDTLPVDGKSFVPLLKDPDDPDWDEVAYSYYRRGITMRTPRYRLTRYFRTARPVTELYDHLADPYENRNIASSRPELVDSLMKVWAKGNTGLFEIKN